MTAASTPCADGRLLRAALSVAARGWYVFPCVPGGKRPALRENWQHLATIDPDRIRRWWNRMPFNIGISCDPSGLVVIDLDVANNDRGSGSRRNGADSLVGLCNRYGQPYPDNTFTVSTPSGGTHLYFEAPRQLVRNSIGRLGPLIDTRAVGGYVLAPVSRIGKNAYEVTGPVHPTPLPAWITDLLSDQAVLSAAARLLPVPGTRQASRYALTALREEAVRVSAARPGTRNDTLNRAAFNLGQLVAADLLPKVTAITALTNAAETCGLPPGEARRTISSGMASGVQHPRARR